MNIEIEKLDREVQEAIFRVSHKSNTLPSEALIALLNSILFSENTIERAAKRSRIYKLKNTESPLP